MCSKLRRCRTSLVGVPRRSLRSAPRAEPPDHQVQQRGEVGLRLPVRGVALSPSPRRGKRHHGLRAPTRCELERHVAAERVTDDVRGLESGRVHGPLDRIGELRLLELPVQRGTAGMTEQRRRQNVVVALQSRQHQLPGPPGIGEPMKAHHRRPGATTMGRGKRRDRGEHGERERHPARTTAIGPRARRLGPAGWATPGRESHGLGMVAAERARRGGRPATAGGPDRDRRIAPRTGQRARGQAVRSRGPRCSSWPARGAVPIRQAASRRLAKSPSERHLTRV